MADQLFRDLRHAVRSLLRDRGFTATTLATLALCLAANAAIFAVVQAVLLRPLPFPEPERLVKFYNAYPGAGAAQGRQRRARLRRPPARDHRLRGDRASTAPTGSTLGGDGTRRSRARHQHAGDAVVLPDPSGGAASRPAVHRRGRRESASTRRCCSATACGSGMFAGRDDAVGQTLRVNGVIFTVVGVMPADFRFVSDEVQLWTPAAFSPEDRSDDRRHNNSWQMLARLKPEATLATGQRSSTRSTPATSSASRSSRRS